MINNLSTAPAPTNGGDRRFDLNALRLSQTFETGATKKLVTMIPTRKPDRHNFIRVHPDPAYHLPVLVFEAKDSRTTYLVHRDLQAELGPEANAKILYLATTRQKNPFLLPVKLPNASGERDAWSQSLAEAADLAMTQWVRIASDMDLGGYAIHLPKVELPEPEWPDMKMEQIIEIAFRHHLIDSPNHPKLRALRGEQ
jgi:hypothetical protein